MILMGRERATTWLPSRGLRPRSESTSTPEEHQLYGIWMDCCHSCAHAHLCDSTCGVSHITCGGHRWWLKCRGKSKQMLRRY